MEFSKILSRVNPDEFRLEKVFQPFDNDVLDFVLQYVVRISYSEFIMFPLKKSQFLTRGMIVKIHKGVDIKLTKPAPMTLLLPGI